VSVRNVYTPPQKQRLEVQGKDMWGDICWNKRLVGLHEHNRHSISACTCSEGVKHRCGAHWDLKSIRVRKPLEDNFYYY
jgi:hypothetical protein